MSGDPGAPINVSNPSPDDPEQPGRPQKVHNYQQPLAQNRSVSVGGGSKWDPVALTPWYTWQDLKRPWLWWQGFFDDDRSYKYKYGMANDLGLGGVLLWDLNPCGISAAPDLWRGLEQAFGVRSGY